MGKIDFTELLIKLISSSVKSMSQFLPFCRMTIKHIESDVTLISAESKEFNGRVEIKRKRGHMVSIRTPKKRYSLLFCEVSGQPRYSIIEEVDKTREVESVAATVAEDKIFETILIYERSKTTLGRLKGAMSSIWEKISPIRKRLI